MIPIKDNRKVAYIAQQSETLEDIIASIEGATSATLVAESPYGQMYVIALSDGTETVKLKYAAPIIVAARLSDLGADFELKTTVGVPIYMIEYLRMSQN